MDKKFTVINNDDIEQLKVDRIQKVMRLNKIWERQYRNSLLQAIEKNKDIEIQDYPQHDLMKIALSGIKFICSLRDVKRENDLLKTGYKRSLEESQAMFQLMDSIFTICGCLTLQNFVTTFPIEKSYDGEKWEHKDYFYTMEVLKEMDWDKPIGRDNVSNLLWDYQNHELRHAYIEYTNAMSAIYRAQTGKGVAETWLEDMGIGTCTINEELGIIQDNQTGKISKICKNSSHLQIIK